MMRPLIRPEMTRVEHRAAAQMHARETMRRTRCKPMRKIAFESPLSHGDAQVGGRHDVAKRADAQPAGREASEELLLEVSKGLHRAAREDEGMRLLEHRIKVNGWVEMEHLEPGAVG